MLSRTRTCRRGRNPCKRDSTGQAFKSDPPHSPYPANLPHLPYLPYPPYLPYLPYPPVDSAEPV